MSLRVLVCGGRNFIDDGGIIHNALYSIHVGERGPISVIIHGGATGADSQGRIWAQHTEGVKHLLFKPDWHTHGRAAGPIRNQRMIDEGNPDLIVAVEGGRGTADMLRRGKRQISKLWS